jgi:hypothetical protein
LGGDGVVGEAVKAPGAGVAGGVGLLSRKCRKRIGRGKEEGEGWMREERRGALTPRVFFLPPENRYYKKHVSVNACIHTNTYTYLFSDGDDDCEERGEEARGENGGEDAERALWGVLRTFVQKYKKFQHRPSKKRIGRRWAGLVALRPL